MRKQVSRKEQIFTPRTSLFIYRIKIIIFAIYFKELSLKEMY